eukprot:CAMPEP_0119546404 /NCGR_PEP_ID=MMETSP1352-20130426/838_1 /TAXON_ID=265584 /ORGANISM="Stauroneis constricta, Strain CCMP1120" /LENGTH=606 /DNA_ID=CAMNT_0007591109 /DNA_START=70 /DNA_END=1890 /DNA_ORIENTATION=-
MSPPSLHEEPDDLSERSHSHHHHHEQQKQPVAATTLPHGCDDEDGARGEDDGRTTFSSCGESSIEDCEGGMMMDETERRDQKPLALSRPSRNRRTSSFLRSLPEVEAFCEGVDDDDEDATTENSSTADVVSTTVDAVPISPRVFQKRVHRPGLISVRVFKDKSSTKLGIVFGTERNRLHIASLSPNSRLNSTPLRSGDRIVSINGMLCQSLSPQQAADIIGAVNNDYVTILAEVPDGDPNQTALSVFKAKSDERLGVYFKSKNGCLQLGISKKPGALGPDPLIRAGDYVVEVNDIPCSGATPKAASALVSNFSVLVTLLLSSTTAPNISSRRITLPDIADSLRSMPRASSATALGEMDDVESGIVRWQGREPMYVSTTVHKPTKDARLGITLRTVDERDEQHIEITKINPDGLLGASSLRAGLRIVSINNQHCMDSKIEDILDLLNSVVGLLHIVALNESGYGSYVQAMAVKKFPTSKIGVLFQRKGRRLRIATIKPESPFASSVLNKGDSVLAINNMPASGLTPTEAAGIVTNARDYVTILTETQTTTGVVIADITQDNFDSIPVLQSSPIDSKDVDVESISPAAALLVMVIIVGLLLLVVTMMT